MANPTNPLDFLNYSQQGYDRLTCQETTVRVLLAILNQANMADSENASDWQTTEHMAIYNHVSKILKIMGMGHIHDQICESGEYQFSTPEKPWVTPADKLESLEGQLREARWDFDHWLETTNLDEGTDEYEDLYWDKCLLVERLESEVREIADTL